MRYLMNGWYVAAFAEDVTSGATLGRTLLGQQVVLFRTDDGQLAALEGRCPHRFAPLASGKVKGAAIECPYHGLRFGTDGACTHNPHGGGHLPRSARVRPFQVAERQGLIWIWMGEAERANPDAIPDYPILRASSPTALITGYLHSAAGYELMADNILDLSHADFLHPGSLATWGEVTKLRPRVNMLIRFACRPSGADQPLEVHGCHLMTPEDERSTHYFFVGTRNYLVDDAELTRLSREQIMFAFSQEDKPIIEAVQRNMGASDLWSLKPVLLACDSGAVQARRKLSALIESQPMISTSRAIMKND